MDEQMAAWMKYAQPGEGHRFLEQLAGKWDARVRFWMQPGAPPIESTGSTVNELMMGGRFLKSEYTAEFKGSPFQGMALDGFDSWPWPGITISWRDRVASSTMASPSRSGASNEKRQPPLFFSTITCADKPPLTPKPFCPYSEKFLLKFQPCF